MRVALKELFIKENAYAKPKEKTAANDFELFEQQSKRDILYKHFTDAPEVAEIFADFNQNLNRLNPKEPEYQARQRLLKTKAFIELDRIYPKFELQIKEEGLLESYYKQILATRETEVFSRAFIAEEFKQTEFDGTRDKGNCTKGITISLLKMQKKYQIPLFDKKMDMEKIAHPQELKELLKPYVKTSESGFIKDCGSLKKGDIVMLAKEGSIPGHAMMCYDFNDKNEPLLLGPSTIAKNVAAYYTKDKKPRRGIVIDIKSFIKDKQNEAQSQKRSRPLNWSKRQNINKM